MKYTLAPGATAPTRATEGSAGYDLAANKTAVLIPGERALISTGVSLQLPADLLPKDQKTSSPEKDAQ